MNELPLLDSKEADPWMYFGSFSRSEVDGAAKLLRETGGVFEIKEEVKQESYPEGGWTGPFSIWVREEHTAVAASLLVPYFKKSK